MINEEEVARSLPGAGFVNDYICYAMRQTTAPLAYHLGTAMTLLATCAPMHFKMRYAGDLHANLYTMLVGRSGEDQKSSALGVGNEILMEAASVLRGDYPGSQEGLYEGLQLQPSQVIFFSEFGKFLAHSQKGHMEPIKAAFAELWDCQPSQKRRANGKILQVPNPRLNLLAACSIPYLETYTNAEDWSGGFMGRWAIMYAQRERTDPDPVGDTRGKAELVNTIRQIASIAQVGNFRGLDPAAAKIWADWFFDVSNRNLPSNIIGVRARAPTIARKAALLFTLDLERKAIESDFYITAPMMELGIRFAEMHVKSVISLSYVLCEHEDARARRGVLQAISSLGGQARLGDLMRLLQRRRRHLVEILDALVEERTVVRQALTNDPVYVLTTSSTRPPQGQTVPVPPQQPMHQNLSWDSISASPRPTPTVTPASSAPIVLSDEDEDDFEVMVGDD